MERCDPPTAASCSFKLLLTPSIQVKSVFHQGLKMLKKFAFPSAGTCVLERDINNALK